ncbi:MAG TPA: energy transducer TonB [Thermoanaerobaculia bacterium]|nr:energy transducer TonB [Thermoanaerobaculia bacterium]
MFETVAPGARSKRLAYETLPVSLVLHIAGVGVAALLVIWEVVFPTHSPRVTQAYVLVTSLDPPLPASMRPPEAPPKPIQLSNRPQYNPNLLVAPPAIPDTIPPMSLNRSPSILTPAAKTTVSVKEPGGVEGGVVGGASQGVAGGMPVEEDGRVHFGRDKPIPLFTDGWIKELDVLEHSKRPAFDDATVKALREWRFKPLVLEGRAIEVVHELTVFYQLVYR